MGAVPRHTRAGVAGVILSPRRAGRGGHFSCLSDAVFTGCQTGSKNWTAGNRFCLRPASITLLRKIIGDRKAQTWSRLGPWQGRLARLTRRNEGPARRVASRTPRTTSLAARGRAGTWGRQRLIVTVGIFWFLLLCRGRVGTQRPFLWTSGRHVTWALVRSSDSWAPPQTCPIRVGFGDILTGLPGDSDAHLRLRPA